MNDSDELESAIIGRITPLVTPRGILLLEAEKSKGNWYEVKKGFAKTFVPFDAVLFHITSGRNKAF